MPELLLIKSPIKKGKNLMDQYRKQLVRNEAKERMYKSNTKVKYLLNSWKHKILNQDYKTIKDKSIT